MAQQKRKDKPMVLLKSLVLVITCLSFGGILSCNGGSGSTTSGGGGGGTGTGWTVTVEKFASAVSISKGETTMVVVKVKDATGSPAPKGSRICLSISFGAIWVDEVGSTAWLITGCVPTSNNNGQLMGTYRPPSFTGMDYVQAASMGAIGSTAIEVVP